MKFYIKYSKMCLKERANMKKKTILLVILIAIIVIVTLFLKGKMQNNKIEYSISDVKEYKYIKYKEKENYGIIDREGNIIIEAVYKKIEIPNPEKDIFICCCGLDDAFQL